MWVQKEGLTRVQTQAGKLTRSLAAQTGSQRRCCCWEEVHPPLLHLEVEPGLEPGLEPQRCYPGSAEALLKHIREKQDEWLWSCPSLIIKPKMHKVLNLPISISSTEDEPWENWINAEEINWTMYWESLKIDKYMIYTYFRLSRGKSYVAYLVTWCILITWPTHNIQGRLWKQNTPNLIMTLCSIYSRHIYVQKCQVPPFETHIPYSSHKLYGFSIPKVWQGPESTVWHWNPGKTIQINII